MKIQTKSFYLNKFYASNINPVKHEKGLKGKQFERLITKGFYYIFFILPLLPVFLCHVASKFLLSTLKLVKLPKSKIAKFLVKYTLALIKMPLSLIKTATNIFHVINPENGRLYHNILKIAAFYLFLPISYPAFLVISKLNDDLFAFHYLNFDKSLIDRRSDKKDKSQIADNYEEKHTKFGAYYFAPKNFDHNKKTLILLHGNDQLFIREFMDGIINPDSKNFNVIVLGYPGYNGALTIPSIKKSVKDLELVIDDIQKTYNLKSENDITVFAHSLGGQIALEYITSKVRTKVAKTILAAPFDRDTYFHKKSFIHNLSSKVLSGVIAISPQKKSSISNTKEILFYRQSNDQHISPKSQQNTFDSLKMNLSKSHKTVCKLEHSKLTDVKITKIESSVGDHYSPLRKINL